jgi:hypothetical protein
MLKEFKGVMVTDFYSAYDGLLRLQQCFHLMRDMNRAILDDPFATLSSAAFLKGAPTPLVIRFSNAGGVPDAPDIDPSPDRVRGMAIKFRSLMGARRILSVYL